MTKDIDRIEKVFSAARQISDRAERVAYLDRVCGSGVPLRARVEKLLGAWDELGTFLDISTPTQGPPLTDESAETKLALTSSLPFESTGSTIGRYKLLQLIGEGGFGAVYMAEQLEPVQRKIALKIIKLGMDTKQVIARFEAERQALAMMDHPNIAKVLDVGATDTGRPYFVMELVKGIPITEYCDKNTLTTNERLDLFIPVCNAVQHAHQKGIIHRDIKPSNVMVTLYDGKPVPKVIDFGIAKATGQGLTEKTLFTEYNQLVGTPLYMSPEQAEMSGLDIDTRTDVYSLGVLLYELLTGTTPFDPNLLRRAAFDEIKRIICEVEPPKPSTRLGALESELGSQASNSPASRTNPSSLTEIADHRRTKPLALSKLIRGDLDWIVMKALEKDRTRRYETATDFARDITHHLADEPVIARPPSIAYQTRKFIQRNKSVVICTCVGVFLLVIVTAAGTTAVVRNSRRITRLTAIADKGLVSASLATARRDYSEAQRELALVKGQLVHEPRLLELYETRIESLLQRADVNLRVDHFSNLADEAWASTPNVFGVGPVHEGASIQLQVQDLRRTQERCKRALAVFDVTASEGGLLSFSSAWDDQDQLESLRKANAELLLLLAGVEYKLGELIGEIHAHSRRAIRYLDRAESLGATFRTLYTYRSLYNAALGEQHAAIADDKRAKTVAVTGWVDHWLHGWRLWDEWKHADALHELESALTLKVDAYWLWYSWGMGAAFVGEPRAKIHRAMSTCIGLEPQESSAWIARGWDGRQPGDSGREAALQDLARGLELATYPGQQAKALSARSVILAELGRTEEAIRVLDEADRQMLGLQQHWDLWLPHDGCMGHAEYCYNGWELETDRMAEALPFLSRLVELRPDSLQLLLTRAHWHMELGRPEPGRADVRTVIELSGTPTSFREHMRRIGMLALTEQWRELVRAASEMKSTHFAWNISPYGMYPNLARAYRHLGHDYLTSGQLEQDLSRLDEANRLQLKHQIAWILVESGAVEHDPELALPLALEVVKARPGRKNFLQTLGAVYYRLGMHDDAIAILQQAIELQEPGDGSASEFFYMAMARWQQGSRESARGFYQQAVDCLSRGERSEWATDQLIVAQFEAATLMGISGAPRPKPKDQPTADRS